MEKIKAGIIGGAGYTGGETIRLLINHPQAELRFVHSNSHAGHPVTDVHTDLLGDTDICFCDEHDWNIDYLFMCVGHGTAREYLTATRVPDHVGIIDLSQDHRLTANASAAGRDFIYGLPEMNRDKIASARNIANPGCFATCIQLAMLPLASSGLLTDDVHVSATTGSTGAGQKPSATTHFSWRANNVSVYKSFEHQHLGEIGESVRSLHPSFGGTINFVPYRGDFTRGIFASLYTRCPLSAEQAAELYVNYYAGAPFTHLSKKGIDLKQVVNTNKCLLHVEKHGDSLLVTAAIDNLLKGASGQAVQNMNIMAGIDETAGLRLKPSAF